MRTMVFGGFVQFVMTALASDAALMLISMLFGLLLGMLLGMLWSGRYFPRRLPRRRLRDID
jgi:NhaP-type Na+/H+ or K+/H+ antiporter